tara:strand:- start:6290 stop:6754 length:465 start_codon:yes stop_codon:yes gene_type:complete
MRVSDRSWEDAALCFLDGGELRDEPLEIESPDPDWPFEVSRRVVREELISGIDRQSAYGERVEWVSQHLDDPLVRPATAPCNAAWSMLVWAQENRKEFYAQQRQVEGKKDEVDAEEKEIQDDSKKYLKLLEGFECFQKLSAAVQGGEFDVYRSA